MENIAIVFVGGLITALATGLGAIPFFFVEDFSDRWNVVLWGTASGIMVAVSLFGLVNEGLAYASTGFPTLMMSGILAGVALVELADKVLETFDVSGSHDQGTNADSDRATRADGADHGDHPLEAKAFAEGDLKTLVLILGILTVHSFP